MNDKAVELDMGMRNLEDALAEEKTAVVTYAMATEAADQYREHRLLAASLSVKLTELEMDRTEMRGKIVKELMAGGLKVTAATEQARTTPEYVKVSRDIMTTTAAWEASWVEAEFYRMQHSNFTMYLQDQYQRQNSTHELELLAKAIESRIREMKK